AEHAIAALIGQDFDEAFGIGVGARSGIGGEGELADLVGDTGRFEILLRAADRGHLRPGVDDAGNGIVIHMALLAGQRLDQGHAFLGGLVRQHRPGDDVADGIDAFDIGGEAAIDGDAPLVVDGDADRLEPEPFGIGTPPDGDQRDVTGDLVARAALRRLERERHSVLAALRRRHLGAKPEGEALLRQHALQVLRQLAIHAGDDAVEELDDRDRAAEATPDRTHLEADIAAADHHQALRYGGESQRAGRGDDGLLVDLDPRQRRHVGAGGDDDRLALELARLTAVDRRYGDASGRQKARCALDVVDLVLLEQELDAARVLADHLVLARHQRLQIELDAGDLDAMLGERVLRLGIFLRGLQQRLGRDATDIETSAAETAALLDAGGTEAQLRCADGGDVAAGAAADDDDVVCWFGHRLLACLSFPLPPLLPSPRGGEEWSDYQTSNSIRSGFSTHSLTRTRKVTASRPSTTRWS